MSFTVAIGIAGWLSGAILFLLWRLAKSETLLWRDRSDDWQRSSLDIAARLKISEDQRHDTIERYQSALSAHRNAAKLCTEDMAAVSPTIDAAIASGAVDAATLVRLRARLTRMSVSAAGPAGDSAATPLPGRHPA